MPRLFVGHFQRFFTFDGLSGRKFFAGEMSIPAPAGLSGGPLWVPENPSKLIAIVSSNMESHSIIDSYEETTQDGEVTRGEIRRQISYGVCVMLSEVGDWVWDRVRNGGPVGP